MYVAEVVWACPRAHGDGSYIKLCGRARGPMGMVRTLSCVGVPVGPWGWFVH